MAETKRWSDAPRWMRRLIVGLGAVSLANCALILIVVATDPEGGSGEVADAEGPEVAPARSPEAPAPEPSGAGMKGEITDASGLAEIREIIHARGFVCPRLARARNRGLGVRGYELEAFCGPEDGGVYSELIFTIVVGEDGHVDSVRRTGLWE